MKRKTKKYRKFGINKHFFHPKSPIFGSPWDNDPELLQALNELQEKRNFKSPPAEGEPSGLSVTNEWIKEMESSLNKPNVYDGTKDYVSIIKSHF